MPPRRPCNLLIKARAEWERCFLLARLHEHDWNVSATARANGINRTDLYKLMHKRGISLSLHRRHLSEGNNIVGWGGLGHHVEYHGLHAVVDVGDARG